MSNELHDFGRAQLFDAEAIGEPGNRRFRLFARSPRGTAVLWMEREQLEALSLAVDQMLSQIQGGDVLRPEALAAVPEVPGAPGDFPADPDLEFQVSGMQLGYDEDHDIIQVRATPIELIEQDGEMTLREDADPIFSILVNRNQATRLSSHIVGILASGRPRCPFCGRPMQPGHVCEKQNGYHPVGLN
jgi:uncharacterized repeat protein (TIGR03847 family)